MLIWEMTEQVFKNNQTPIRLGPVIANRTIYVLHDAFAHNVEPMRDLQAARSRDELFLLFSPIVSYRANERLSELVEEDPANLDREVNEAAQIVGQMG